MSFKGFSFFSFSGYFVQWSRMTLAILVEAHRDGSNEGHNICFR